MAAISPIGLIIFRGVFARREEEAIEEAKQFAEEQKRLTKESSSIRTVRGIVDVLFSTFSGT